MSRARDLAKLGNTDVIAVNGTDVGFGTRDPKEKVNVVGVVSATSFFGDGSGLDGIASAGIGTALSDDKTKALNTIYYTNNEVLVTNNSVVNPPASGHIAYTQAPTLVIDDTKEITISDGDDLLVDVLGISTGVNVDYAARGNGVFGNIYVDNIYNQSGQTSVNFPKGIVSSGITTITDGTQSTSTLTGALQVRGGVGIAKSVYIGGNLSVGGTITYEDVTNVDSVGLITARNGIRVTAGDVAIGLANPGLKLHIQDGALPSAPAPNGNCDMVLEGTTNTGIQFLSGTQTQLRFGDADSTAAGAIIYKHTDDNFKLNFSNSGYLSLNDGGGENLRFTPNNEIGIAGANYGTSGQVLTSGGTGAAVQWADAGGGAWEVVSTHVLSGSTSYIDSNGWSNAYQRYKLVMDDIYYGGTLFKCYLRVYQDSTSGNAGTLKTASQYAYGSMDGQEAWGGMSSVPRQGTFGDYAKLGYNRDCETVNMAEYQFGMQTNVSHGSTYPYWHGTMSRNANIHLADNGIYNADKTEFLTGIRLFFFGSNGSTAINPSQGRVTILRMKYS